MTNSIRNLLSIIILLAVFGSFSSLNYSEVSALGVNGFQEQSDSKLASREYSKIIDQDVSERDQTFNLLSTSLDGLTFEVIVPWEELNFEIVTLDSKEFVRVSLPEWSEISKPGEPALPTLSTHIGVPLGADLEVNVEPGISHVHTLSKEILPKVTQIEGELSFSEDQADFITQQPNLVYQKDLDVYEGYRNYPGFLAEISQDGFLRQQRVAGVSVFPVQYNPGNKEITVFESLLVTVKFTGSSLIQNAIQKPDSQIYERILSAQLINYDSARNWRTSSNLESTSLSANQITYERSQTPNPGWRVKVRGEGIYELSYGELQTAGLEVDSLDPRSFQMFYLGSEIAIQVIGEQDGSFDQEDIIRFYGQEIESKYTSDNVYWLTYGNIVQGLRMESRYGVPADASTPDNYQAFLRLEENNKYYSTISGSSVYENFVWDRLLLHYMPEYNYPTLTHNFNLYSIHDSPATLSVSFYGNYSNVNNPDHNVKVFINDIEVGEVFWDGFNWETLEATIPAGVLQVGNNSIQLTGYRLDGISYDLILIDRVEINYHNSFIAQNDQLQFNYETNGDLKFSVDGFVSDQVDVFDITEPLNPQIFTGVSIENSGLGYRAVFQDTLSSLKKYIATGATGFRQVQSLESDEFSNLNSTTNEADHVVIYHSAFKTAAENLRDYRQSEGMRALAVDVQDVYDEFNHGIVDPIAIKDFLTYAYNSWTGAAPSYVVLMGDGTYDPKNYQGNDTISFIPPYLLPVDPWMGETAADNRYVTISGTDTMPDMMLGRISVNSASEAESFVAKIIEYETAPMEDWKNQVLAVADNPDGAGNFASISDNLLSCCLPSEYGRERIYFGYSPYTDAGNTIDAIKNSISSGKLLVNYIGHGGTASWAGESLFHSTYVSSLTNAGKYPVSVAMACLEGYYIRPETPTNYHAVGEVFTRAVNKGAIASWSATGEGVASGHTYLNQGFYNALFEQNATTVGEAAQAGKLNLFSAGASPDLLDTYLLFGDPATVVMEHFKAYDDSYSTDQDTPVSQTAPGVLLNDVYSGDGSITAELVTNPTNGTVSLSSDGSFVYTPNTNFSGSDSFSYQAADGSDVSNIATVSITVFPANSAPLANDDVFTTMQDKPLVVYTNSLMANDTDLDEDVLLVTQVSNPVNGNVVLEGTIITFTPALGFYGTAGFDYTLSDGELTDIGHVTVTVEQEINESPIVQDIPDQTIGIGESFEIIMLDTYVYDPNDKDNELVWTYSGNSDLILSIDSSRYVTISPPDGSWTGSETITFRATDPGGLWDEDTATFTIEAVNQPPVAMDDSYEVLINESLTVSAPGVLANDSDPDEDPITALLSSGPSNGSLTLNPDGSFTYVPKNKFVGTDTFTYTAYDGNINSNAGTVTIIVSESNTSQVSIPLYEGWNLVSFNLVPPSSAVADVLSSIEANYSLVYAWDPDALDEHWLKYDPSAEPYANDLTTLDHTMGFWINMTFDDTLVISGTQPESTDILLSAGWNLVGYPAVDPQALPSALENNGVSDYIMVMAHQRPDSEPWKIYDPSAPAYANDLLEMTPGWGYWIEANTESTWNITYDLP